MSYSKQTWDTNSYVNPTRMNHIEDGIADDCVQKTGDTMSGILEIHTTSATQAIFSKTHTGTSAQVSDIVIGNNIPDGTQGSSLGRLRLYDSTNKLATIRPKTGGLTADRMFYLPDKDGTVALTGDLVKKLNTYIDLTTDNSGVASSHTLASLYPNYNILACIITYNYLITYGSIHLDNVWYYAPGDYIYVEDPNNTNGTFRIYFTLLYTDK